MVTNWQVVLDSLTKAEVILRETRRCSVGMKTLLFAKTMTNSERAIGTKTVKNTLEGMLDASAENLIKEKRFLIFAERLAATLGLVTVNVPLILILCLVDCKYCDSQP